MSLIGQCTYCGERGVCEVIGADLACRKCEAAINADNERIWALTDAKEIQITEVVER